jgi:hypothetical protein
LDVFGGVMKVEATLGDVGGEYGGEEGESAEGVNVAFGD